VRTFSGYPETIAGMRLDMSENNIVVFSAALSALVSPTPL